MPELHEDNEHTAACRATVARTRPCSPRCRCKAWEPRCFWKERPMRRPLRSTSSRSCCPVWPLGKSWFWTILRAHKGARVRQLIEEHGCQLLFLPAYSPDFSPIEETFSKLKANLRRVGARTREALQEAIAQALETVTSQDARGWFAHCGYLPSHERKA